MPSLMIWPTVMRGFSEEYGSLENQLHAAAEDAHFIVFEARKIDAVVQIRVNALELRIVPILRAQRVDLLLLLGQLNVQLLNRLVILGDFGLCRRDLFIRRVGLLAALLELLMLIFRIRQIQLGFLPLFAQLFDFDEKLVFRHVGVLNGLQILHRHQAADDIRHIQKRVVSFFLRVVELFLLGVLRFFIQLFVMRADFPALCVKLFVLFVQRRQIFNHVFHIFRRDFVDLAAVVHRAAVRLLIELEQRAAQRGFAAAAFADQTEGLALVDIQRHAVVCLDVKTLFLQWKPLLEVGDADQHLIWLFHVLSSFEG